MADIFGDDDNGKNNNSEFAEMLDAVENENRKDSLKVGSKVQARIISIGRDSIFLDMGTRSEGVIDRNELLNSEGELTYKVGDFVDLFVVSLRNSEIRLSKAVSSSGGDLTLLKEAFISNLPIEGKVKAVVKGGYEVEVMKKRAFCPISQMDLKFIEQPENFLNCSYNFVITQFDERGRNIVVSRRKLLEQEREQVSGSFFEKLSVGQILSGKVTRTQPFGAFVEIAPGIDGLVHVSELSWSRIENAQDFITVGTSVQVKVIGIERREPLEKSKISLSMKQNTQEPWENVPTQFQVGQTVSGRVTRIMNFGAFVEVTSGVEGLIPLSEMSYTHRVVKADELIKAGDAVSVVIKEIDLSRRRISLSLRDAEGDPWSLVPEKYQVGQTIQGIIEKRERFGLFIIIEPGVKGLLPKARLSNSPDAEQIEKAKDGDRITVTIDDINLEQRKISLSPGDAKDIEEWKNYSKEQNTHSMGSLGEKFMAALNKKN